MWIVSCAVVFHGAAVFRVVLFTDGKEAVGFEWTGTFDEQARVLVHRGGVGSDLPNAVACVVVVDSHSWNAVPYLLEILQWVYHGLKMRL